MRIYETTSTFKAAPISDMDALLSAGGNMKMICADTPLRSIQVQLSGVRARARARIFPSGTIVVTARNVEQVAVAAREVAGLLKKERLPRRVSGSPTVVRASAKVARMTVGVFRSLLANPPPDCDCKCCDSQFRMTYVMPTSRMDVAVYRSGAVLMTLRRPGGDTSNGKKTMAVFKEMLKKIRSA